MDTQKKKRKFSENLPDLFDIAHADALTTIKLPEDKYFLTAQREKGRQGCMGLSDLMLAQNGREDSKTKFTK